ncbi:MAG: hypothetical protein A3G32_04770 [Deltaproteobacteria bacterium RIFCSPLOWO2_12_FULL_40_28]|nr:MAG: hypothetical protein A3C45_08880 [Deltaproteobacteria bacterium RIFCSPHIGHO2_02_FULL_40_28]OGQ19683.1 MAG: hypothetical protein A3E27_08075 [Deltaproteobacteria bacterium RIFCSPHIGHO2_12_FULL_40_32]OGQ40960.1 MAG: hypothetical protein A3I69_03490 [Deltaproteobacteria bacterium RIFCSPLOWO2_02_FULL_40_36]OGQ54075.1 MAG: hypothetical protein A3G32_04770 [Deltaproteobacteria bacterium RIFCSPLOWO2_12_FULL_40_28]
MLYLFFRTKKEDVCLIKQIIESYENMLDLSTIDSSSGKIQVSIAKDFEKEARLILEDLGKRFTLIPLDEPSDKSQGNY